MPCKMDLGGQEKNELLFLQLFEMTELHMIQWSKWGRHLSTLRSFALVKYKMYQNVNMRASFYQGAVVEVSIANLRHWHRILWDDTTRATNCVVVTHVPPWLGTSCVPTECSVHPRSFWILLALSFCWGGSTALLVVLEITAGQKRHAYAFTNSVLHNNWISDCNYNHLQYRIQIGKVSTLTWHHFQISQETVIQSLPSPLVQHRTHIVRRFTCGNPPLRSSLHWPPAAKVSSLERMRNGKQCAYWHTDAVLLCRCTAPAPGKVIVNSHLSIYQFVYYNLILCCCPLHQFIHFHPAAKLNQLSQVNSKKQTPTNRPHKWHNLCNHDWGINRCRAFAAFALHAEPTTMEWNPNLSNSRSEALVLQKDHLGAQVGHDF